MITAKTILRSRNTTSGHVLSTLLLRYPRYIHAELMTHRVFSRNAASSRAIPVARLIAEAEDSPATPEWWGAEQKGMQASAELPEDLREEARLTWDRARFDAITHARELASHGAHKQIVNRLLEPYIHITVLVSSTEWDNFLSLRDHPAAEPHIQRLARAIRRELDTAPITDLQPGDWHLPFVDEPVELGYALRLSTARCASTSYKTVDNFDMTLERATGLHDKLMTSVPMHASPAEHVARVDDCLFNPVTDCWVWANPETHGNFTGFCQYRHLYK